MNNSSKSKKLLIILIPIVLLAIVLSISYAYWKITSIQESLNKIDSLKCLETTITDETNAISLYNEYPIPNSEGMQKDPYTFKITNICNIYVIADVALEVLNTSTLIPQYVRASVNKKGVITDNSKILTNYEPGIAVISGATSYIVKGNNIILPKSSISLDLRIWLDEATTTEQGFSKTFESKIVVSVSPEKEPVHLVFNLPNNGNGGYTATFEGASWNHRSGALEINKLTESRNVIDLTNIGTEGTVNLAEYIIGLAGTEQGTGKLINENGYRYEGKSPNNWLMFNGEYWRIIGVFNDTTHGKTNQNLVKIIREDAFDSLVWSKNSVNNWSESSLKTLLNTNYYNGTEETILTNCYASGGNIPAKCDFTINGITKKYYRDMVENVTWKLGGGETEMPSITKPKSYSASMLYNLERGTNVYGSNPVQANAYIGLIYSSDYGYSVLESSCNRTTTLDLYNTASCAGQSWLNGNCRFWTLTPASNENNRAFYINRAGELGAHDSVSSGIPIRPALYLKSNTMKLSGDGSSGNPYIIVR